GIRANCIAPETILTERNKQRIPSAQQQDLVALHPIRRLGTPADVAHAALYLACDDAAWIAGVILDVAGGAVMVSSRHPRWSVALPPPQPSPCGDVLGRTEFQ